MFVYLDESGRLDAEDTAKRPTIAGVIIPEKSLNDATSTLLNLKRELCPPFINPEMYELKANKILRPSAGGWKIELAERFFCDYFVSLEDVRVVAVVCRRPSKLLKSNSDILPLHHIWLLTKIFNYMQENKPDEFASFVYDSQGNDADERLSREFTSYLYRHPQGQEFLRSITPTPLFVNSSLVPGIELADMIAGCLRHQADAYDEQNTSSPKKAYSNWHLSRYTRYKRIIEQKQAELSPNQYSIQYASKDAMERVLAHAEGKPLDNADVEPEDVKK